MSGDGFDPANPAERQTPIVVLAERYDITPLEVTEAVINDVLARFRAADAERAALAPPRSENT